MVQKIKIAMIQFGSKIGEVEANTLHAQELIDQAASQDADIVCLPELFATGYNLTILKERSVELSLQYYDFITEKMSESAKKNKINLIAGYGRKTELPGIAANSAMIFGPGGQLIGHFDKVHLWALEAFYYKHGNSFPVFTVNIDGYPLTIGIMVCYDAGFPEAARSLALSGAEIIFCPSAWRVEDTDMWDLNIAQRALENQLFTVGVNHGGMEGDLNLFGKSKICGPRGHVISECPAEKEVVQVVEIDLDEETAFRRDCAYLRDRNPRAYFKLTEA